MTCKRITKGGNNFEHTSCVTIKKHHSIVSSNTTQRVMVTLGDVALGATSSLAL